MKMVGARSVFKTLEECMSYNRTVEARVEERIYVEEGVKAAYDLTVSGVPSMHCGTHTGELVSFSNVFKH